MVLEFLFTTKQGARTDSHAQKVFDFLLRAKQDVRSDSPAKKVLGFLLRAKRDVRTDSPAKKVLEFLLGAELPQVGHEEGGAGRGVGAYSHGCRRCCRRCAGGGQAADGATRHHGGRHERGVAYSGHRHGRSEDGSRLQLLAGQKEGRKKKVVSETWAFAVSGHTYGKNGEQRLKFSVRT